jgi:hypothetical protein
LNSRGSAAPSGFGQVLPLVGFEFLGSANLTIGASLLSVRHCRSHPAIHLLARDARVMAAHDVSIAFSSEVDTGSREENALNQDHRASRLIPLEAIKTLASDQYTRAFGGMY